MFVHHRQERIKNCETFKSAARRYPPFYLFQNFISRWAWHRHANKQDARWAVRYRYRTYPAPITTG